NGAWTVSLRVTCLLAGRDFRPRTRIVIQGINDGCLRGMIRGGILPPGNTDRAVAGVVVRPVFFMFRMVIGRFLRIAKLTVNQSEIVMRGEVFGIDDESLLKLSHSLLKKIFLDYRVRMFHFRPLDIRLTKLVNHFVVLAEIKPAAFEFGVMV